MEPPQLPGWGYCNNAAPPPLLTYLMGELRLIMGAAEDEWPRRAINPLRLYSFLSFSAKIIFLELLSQEGLLAFNYHPFIRLSAKLCAFKTRLQFPARGRMGGVIALPYNLHNAPQPNLTSEGH
ncbi:hypothetical protein CEXT_788391 [Caerostris extrusa]|uniref:Uncharacterized protein n=1 Tax=Caerostris extrusa TaxID=172846 RepID=A0AAV4WVW3_CAEEX|nr:hypothetical protein CEXT_788391 [Caerostris extrusa]